MRVRRRLGLFYTHTYILFIIGGRELNNIRFSNKNLNDIRYMDGQLMKAYWKTDCD